MLQALDKLRDESFGLRLDQATKFDDLAKRLQDISKHLTLSPEEDLVAQTDESTPDDSSAGHMLRQLASSNRKPRKLNSGDIKSLVEGISSLTLTEHDLAVIAKEQAFIRTLNFPSRPFRHDDILIAHKKTFQWILDPSQDTQNLDPLKEHSLLLKWLRHGNGTFWVSGRAGSGKSTLMKFVSDHEESRRSLEEWASPKKLVIATHYFWATGTSMQNSQQGLLRSLLYDISRMCPEQIPDICPIRWSKTSVGDHAHAKEWSTHELIEALRTLARLPTTPTKYCMFIDGVDEFDGDHFELCQVLKELSMSPNVKCCLSSRPWNVFEDAFGIDETHKLYIHDLTRQDISVYAQSRLMEHPRWNETYFSKEQMKSVIYNITQRAHGVFLWVFLVTKSLRDGLVNGDTVLDLQRRLESLPTDLEPFFKHMLDVIEPLYHQKMARVLRIAVNAKQSLDLQFYQIHEYEEEDKDYALNKSTESHAPENLDATLDQCRRRINARCGGLLEIKKDRVEFLHRTVRDFLLTREMNDYLCKKSGRDFMVNLSTLKGYVFLFKCWVQNTDWMHLGEDEPFWRECLKYANDAIEESEESALMHLDAVEDLYQNISGSNDSEFLNVTPDFTFRSELLGAGVDRYVFVKLQESPTFFNSLFELPLCTTINQPQWSQGHVNIITKLLESGVDPNDGDSESPWYQFVQRTCTKDDDDDYYYNYNFRIAVENSLFSIFLKQLARKDLRIHSRFSDISLELMGDGITPATTQLDPKFPCTHFIMALFHHRYSHRFPNECFCALEDFLTGSPEEVKLQFDEILSTLQDKFKKLVTRTTEPGRLRFFARITQKIIVKGNQAGSNMEMLVPDLLALFSGGSGSALADMIRNKDNSPHDHIVRTPLKRRRDHHLLGTPPCKRAKPDSSMKEEG